MKNCNLAIGPYPTFSYDASGGGGTGSTKKGQDSRISLKFDPEKFYIPPINYTTTKLLGLPIPPGVNIDIVPEKIEGEYDKQKNCINLIFQARFLFSIGTLLKAPDLLLTANLTNTDVNFRKRAFQSSPFTGSGNIVLVSVSTIQKTGNLIYDSFLTLPAPVLAVLHCKIDIIDGD